MKRLLDVLFSALRAAAVTAAVIWTASVSLKCIACPSRAELNTDCPQQVWAEAEQWAEVEP